MSTLESTATSNTSYQSLDYRRLGEAVTEALSGVDVAVVDSQEVPQLIKKLSQAVEPAVIEIRRFLHAHPEQSLKEVETAHTIAHQLEALGIPYYMPYENSVVATIKGTAPCAYDSQSHPRKRLLMRADIDALPVQEETGAPYASQTPGIMHACGHDCHAAMLLGAAAILSCIAPVLCGEVRLVFQPAEENSTGASMMVKAGVCDGVDGAYGCHIWSEVPAGKVSLEAGPRMANADWWRIDIKGKSAHGALPHRGADAILAGAAIIEELQTIVSRSVSPFEPAVVTVGQFHGGTARNVVAGSAWLEGTVRTFDPEIHARMPLLMKRVAEETAAALGCEATVSQYDLGSWAVVNDAQASQIAARAAEAVLGKEAIARYRGSMPGEDFSEYLFEVPGVFVFLGCANPSKGPVHPQHSCFYNPDETVLKSGVALEAAYAWEFLGEGLAH